MAVIKKVSDAGVSELRRKLMRFQVDDPDVSIVIPAYNEEKTIAQLLESLADQKTQYRVELIVANNNSTDGTQALLDQYGVRSVFVRQQGVAYARQAGLEAARGTYVANADADSTYPQTWLDTLLEPLHNPTISCTYGTYSFVAASGGGTLSMVLYERISRIAASLRRYYREYTNVLGFNFAFRRTDALAIGGYDLDTGHQGGKVEVNNRCEDGWMALCLMQKGRLHRVSSPKARACTSNRRLVVDGGMQQAFMKRLRREWIRIIAKKSLPIQL